FAIAFAVSARCVNHGLVSSSVRSGPGLTLDESFNVGQGIYLFESALDHGPLMFTPSGAEQVFGRKGYLPDHPPLGRLAIGAVHELTRPLVASQSRELPYSVVSARLASAMLFAVTVWLVGWYAARWYGALAGIVAAASLCSMPRAFGHAHLAALETAIGLMFTGTVLFAANRLARISADRVASQIPFPWWPACLTGLWLGLALLTKIQAVLLPIPIGLWAVWQWRWRAVPLMLLVGVVGVFVFLIGWPWLWLDPVAHLREYFASKAQRPTLYCYYLGQRYADVDIPWHYPVVLFLVTMPAGLHLLGLWGLWFRSASAREATGPRVDPRIALPAVVVVFVLGFFALPGVTVYDGARLFLVIAPLWAVIVGTGVARLWRSSRTNRVRRWSVVLLMAAGVGDGLWGLAATHPCYLSYYSIAVGGLRGADRIGLEPTYWRDSLTREFLDEVADAVPSGTTLYVAPVLHPANRIDLELLSPILQQHGLRLDSFDDRDPAKTDMRYVLVFRRHADPWSSLEPAPAGGTLVCEVRRSDVQLTALYDLSGP
ncbi:MAG: glycosyltransferase family 39 protein, partial [Planctomycetaceae bacterium]|nr:glycosyltransferase family 39 protein [Planctomycetaceae bacterium]